MSKASRRRRARDRIDVRLWENRPKKNDMLRWQFPEWNKERIQQLDRWDKSHGSLEPLVMQRTYFLDFYEQLIHKGRKKS